MSGVPPKYKDVIDWLLITLESVEGDNCKVILNVNGSEVDADLITNSNGVDDSGRKVKIERRTTTRLRIVNGKRTVAPPLTVRRF